MVIIKSCFAGVSGVVPRTSTRGPLIAALFSFLGQSLGQSTLPKPASESLQALRL
jgi:hypothetical protein